MKTFDEWLADNIPVGVAYNREDMRRGYEGAVAQMQAARASPADQVCATCNGHGMIGGPSFYAPDEGGEPCPDCATPADHSDDWQKGYVAGRFDLESKVAKTPQPPQNAADHNDIEQYVLSVLPSVYYMDPPDGGNVSILEQLRRMADDAAKYRASINAADHIEAQSVTKEKE